jgi:hypothetical protein
MSRLEGRCRRLLRAYPQPYRTDRGEEIVGTLLDAAPASRNWPPARDAWSLIAGGLRVRAARNRQFPLATNLRLAALLAAALWLGESAATYLDFAIHRGTDYGLPTLSNALFAACALGACLTITSAWLWRRRVTATLALAVTAASALACSQAHYLGDVLSDVRLIGPPLVLAALAMRKDRPPRCWLWMPGAFLIAPLPALFPNSAGWWWPLVLALFPAVFLGILGIALLWLFVDARPAIAFGMYFELIYVLRSFATASQPGDAPTIGQGLIMTLIAAALAGAALRVRRIAKT